MASERLQPKGWGRREVFIGLGLLLLFQALTTAAFGAIVVAKGADLRLSDRGDDVFDKANIALDWGQDRAVAVANGEALPTPPHLYADLFAVKVGFSTTLVFEVMLVGLVAVMTRQTDLRALIKTFGLDRFDFNGLWVPVVAVIGTYALTAAFIVTVQALGLDALTPRSNVPSEIVRDDLGLIMAGVLALIAAPLGEEFFFRGFMITGLLRWGAWPAIATSAMIFAIAHLSLGAIFPFFIAGCVMGWLYWRRGSLWDSMAFHFLFNATSYALLLTTR